MMSSNMLESRFPHDDSLIASYEVHTDKQVDQILDQVCARQKAWKALKLAARLEPLRRIAASLREEAEMHARMMTVEMGKPIKQARAEVEKCAWLCEYYAEAAPGFLQDIKVSTQAEQAAIVFQPLGVVLAIMPWNYPYWQAFRFAIPAIVAGNGIVLKHAANVSGCALAMEALFAEHFPEQLFSTLLLRSERMGGIIADQRISAVTFTGSTSAGRKVGAAAGGALKKAVLELGGSDPYIVLADADIGHAAKVCAAARLVNAGQSCIAAKRFIVVDAVHDAFVEAFAAELGKGKLGNPMEEQTDIGPMARADLVDELEQQVKRTLQEGATLVLGAERPAGAGAYYAPTLLIDVRPDMTAAREELFGPVAPVIRASNTEDAIAIANDSEFGLGGAIFTADSGKAWQLASEALETGAVAINAQLVSDPRLPFGGIKHSGFGRELGEFGIREFVNVKSISRFKA